MKKYALIILLALCLLLSACGGTAAQARTRTVFAMDTVMNLTIYGGKSAALDDAERELYRLDALLARGKEGSAVYALNRDGAVNDAEIASLARCAAEISAASDGAFDATVAPVLELWGFGSGASEHRVPTDAELSAARARVNYRALHVSPENDVTLDAPAEIDLGGIAKGYAGVCVKLALREQGVESAVIDLGGDVALLGSKPDGSPWRVAIKDPADGGACLGILATEGDVFVMTSGVYERFFEENGVRYHHIIDPRTGFPAESGVVSATVVCRDGAAADALATAACVLGAEGALALRERLSGEVPFNLILVTEEGNVLYTNDNFTPETGNGYVYERVS